jgi:hypothetical protein
MKATKQHVKRSKSLLKSLSKKSKESSNGFIAEYEMIKKSKKKERSI